MHQRSQYSWSAPWRGWLILVALLLALGGAHAADGFLEPGQAFRLQVEPGTGRTVVLQWTIAPGYYLYRDRITVSSAAGGPVGKIVRPPGVRKDDPNFGAVDIYHDAVRVEVDPGAASALAVAWQGCAEQGLCYPPQQRTVPLDGSASAPAPGTSGGFGGIGGSGLPGLSPDVAAALHSPPQPSAAPTGAPAQAAAAPAVADLSTDSGISRVWSGHSLWWSLPFAFVLGIGLAFTPCVLPMVPILSGMVVGQQARGRRALLLSLAFVIPMALVYAAVGLLAAVAGAGFQAALQNPWAIGGFAVLFALLAFSMFGFYELQLPAWIRDRLAARTPAGGTLAGAAAMGVVSALLVGPCMTAPLAGTLLYVAQSGQRVEGGLLLLALGLGMGVPLIVISTIGARWMPRPGVWMNRVKGAFGFVMLATAAWMLQRVLPGALMLLVWGTLLTALAVTVWHLAATGSGSALAVRSAAALAGIWGAALVFGAAAGASDPLRPLAGLVAAEGGTAATTARFEVLRDPALVQARLAQARGRGQPALLEFSADWCTSCKTLEHEVFADPQVVRALDGVLLLRADVTAGDARQRAFMRSHAVMGPPTVLLFDAAGTERRADRLVGEFAPEELLRRAPAGAPS